MLGRKYPGIQLRVPRNCVASRSDSDLAAALAFMKVNLKADVSSSGADQQGLARPSPGTLVAKLSR